MKRVKKLLRRKALSGLLVCFLISLWSVPGAYAAFITPKRIIIEDGQRAATLTIINNSDKAMVYRFSWEHRAQSPAGQSLLLEDGQSTPGYRPADNYLVFSPRQVVLKSGQSQKIRILARRTADMEPGEYHSHLLIDSDIAVDTDQGTGNEPPPREPGLSGILKIRANASIPVFLRQGKTELNIKLKGAKIVKKGIVNDLAYSIENSSTRSIYAQVVLDCKKSSGETSSRVVTAARIYSEAKNLNQEVAIPVDFPLTGCTGLQMRMNGIDDFEYRNKLIDQIAVSQ